MSRRKRLAPSTPSFSLKPLIFTVLATILLSIIFFTSPTAPGLLPLFFIVLFLTLSLLFSTIIKNSRRLFTLAFAACFFLVLRYFNLGNALNFLLLLGSLLAFEFYLSNHS